MAGRRKGERKIVLERAELSSLFYQAARRIYLSGCFLDAYRRSSGVLVEMKRTAVARETMEMESRRCDQSFNRVGSVSDAHEHAGRWAMKSYLGNWWSHRLMDLPPNQMGQGDEFFSRHTVGLIVEQHRDFVPDRKG